MSSKERGHLGNHHCHHGHHHCQLTAAAIQKTHKEQVQLPPSKMKRPDQVQLQPATINPAKNQIQRTSSENKQQKLKVSKKNYKPYETSMPSLRERRPSLRETRQAPVRSRSSW